MGATLNPPDIEIRDYLVARLPVLQTQEEKEIFIVSLFDCILKRVVVDAIDRLNPSDLQENIALKLRDSITVTSQDSRVALRVTLLREAICDHMERLSQTKKTKQGRVKWAGRLVSQDWMDTTQLARNTVAGIVARLQPRESRSKARAGLQKRQLKILFYLDEPDIMTMASGATDSTPVLFETMSCALSAFLELPLMFIFLSSKSRMSILQPSTDLLRTDYSRKYADHRLPVWPFVDYDPDTFSIPKTLCVEDMKSLDYLTKFGRSRYDYGQS